MPPHEPQLLEITELPNGDIVLRRPDDTGEPLVRIHFSKESIAFLGNHRQLVAKAMIEAGIETLQDLQENSQDPTEELDPHYHAPTPPVYH